MSQYNLIVGVLSCEKTTDRRNACRVTWVKDLNSLGIRCYFLVGNPEQDEEFIIKDDVLYLKCPDTYKHLPQKTHLFCKWAMSQEFDYLLKCDDDSYVYANTLNNYTLAYDYIGTFSAGHYFSGAGYFLSRKAAAIIASEMTEKEGAEDKLCGYHLDLHGKDIKWRKEKRIKGWGSNLSDDEQRLHDPSTILDHYNRKELMFKKHAISRESVYTPEVINALQFKSLQRKFRLPEPTIGQEVKLTFKNNIVNPGGELNEKVTNKNIISVCNVSVDTDGDGVLSLVDASSEEVTGYAIECLSTDITTQWHTQFRKGLKAFPHTLTLKLNTPQTISAVNIIPRQTSPKNGIPKDVDIDIS
jgi:hypothetical protein